MQLIRARTLVVGLDDPPGRLGDVGVDEHLVLRARVVDVARACDSRSMPLSFQRRVGSSILARKRRSCSSSETENQYLTRMNPVFDEQPLEPRALRKEALVLLRRTETHHLLDAGAVVPAAIEERDLATGRQVLDIALEVPL